LPVSYDRSVKAVESILKSNNVDFILMFGLAANRSCISLEMMAQKHCNSNSPDADQVILKNQTSNTSAKADYLKSIWPLEDWENEMKSLSIPAEVSLDAGGYVCNFLYFNMLQLTKNCLFVHLPQKNDPLILQEAVYFLLKKLSQSIVLSIDP
jgi:pyroglutamyl-peptidase